MAYEHSLIFEGYPAGKPVRWSTYLNGVLIAEGVDRQQVLTAHDRLKEALRNYGGTKIVAENYRQEHARGVGTPDGGSDAA